MSIKNILDWKSMNYDQPRWRAQSPCWRFILCLTLFGNWAKHVQADLTHLLYAGHTFFNRTSSISTAWSFSFRLIFHHPSHVSKPLGIYSPGFEPCSAGSHHRTPRHCSRERGSFEVEILLLIWFWFGLIQFLCFVIQLSYSRQNIKSNIGRFFKLFIILGEFQLSVKLLKLP